LDIRKLPEVKSNHAFYTGPVKT